MDNENKCPVMHGALASNSNSGTSNKDWWPNQLNLYLILNYFDLKIHSIPTPSYRVRM